MMISKALLASLFVGSLSVAAFAQSESPTAFSTAASSGTPEQQAACRPDVRKFCRKVAPGSGDMAYLACLKTNRAKLSKACRTMLESHGQ
jgi:hypothetical protein